MALMPTQSIAQTIQERTMKQLTSDLQQELVKILQSVVLVEEYPGTSLVFNFNITDMDSELMQAMVNCAGVALASSEVKCRGVPVAVSMLVMSERKGGV